MECLLSRLRNEDISERIYVVGIDHFIHPKHIRYDKSKEEWYCYYDIQWRYDYLVGEILLPIKNGRKIDKLIELYDKENDIYVLEPICIPPSSILLLEEIFLQRKELKNYLDFTIYLDVPQEMRLKRVLLRDKYIGKLKDIRHKYERRYFPAEEKYISEYSPIENADFILRYR